ncbi:hypothetical protein HZF05_12925 [Sphingomonas sp. CGMCC 1.13654]|uniref:Uncharacterized protein n=1 Tax=Sphingomonas chungangi TaxID=2683589 RepID=A0A838L6P5_9SPHN|nr:hypothetical protein [Sphingomonas chungangi]MBA2935001.1 hypothetical protein [Sphingomonas chungangi]MVW54116.1 hypothetical protein [Sphingomonas chungangi]
MISLALASLLAVPSAQPAPHGDAANGIQVADVVVSQSIIIRVPARRSQRYRPAGEPPAAPAFKEHKGPKCIDAATIGGAAVTAPNSVDFIVKGGKRMRAVLEDECPALDYYSGFYFRAPADGKLCADRDSIHTRSGGECQIDKFRALTPIDPGR